MEPWVIVAVGGVLPFGSIFIEMYFIFTSFWAYKIYYVYGFMLLGESINVIETDDKQKQLSKLFQFQFS